VTKDVYVATIAQVEVDYACNFLHLNPF
jgi:hypothetical protein